MKKEWYAIFFIMFGLPLCLGVFVPLLINLTKPTRNLTEMQDKPERIVSLAPNLTEILFELGLGERVVAVSNNSDYPAEAIDKKKIGTFWQPDTEAIIAAKPDLIITLHYPQQKSVADSLKRLGYQVLSLKIEKIAELFTAISKIAATTGCRQQADELVKNLQNKLNNLQSKFNSTNKPRVLWVVQAEPLRAAGRNTFINEFIELAGGENAIGPTIQQYPAISTEELLVCRAEVIIQSAMEKSNITKQQQTAEAFWSKWPTLSAVKNKRIYVVQSDAVMRLGPRLPQGVEMIGRCLYPDIFR